LAFPQGAPRRPFLFAGIRLFAGLFPRRDRTPMTIRQCRIGIGNSLFQLNFSGWNYF
jgi:hypothetical protein